MAAPFHIVSHPRCSEARNKSLNRTEEFDQSLVGIEPSTSTQESVFNHPR